jgi:hypothetical protein
MWGEILFTKCEHKVARLRSKPPELSPFPSGFPVSLGLLATHYTSEHPAGIGKTRTPAMTYFVY